MRKAGWGLAFLAFICLSSGCSKSPRKVFAVLKEAALDADADVVWENITDTTRAELDRLAGAREDVDGGKALLAVLANGLDEMAVEYIKTLRPGEVSVNGDTALMSVGSIHFGPSDKPLIFYRDEGRWKWDARDILKWYLEKRGSYAEFFGGI